MQNNVVENRIKLKPYYFAYMDILGAKKYIESEESENYLNKIQRLYAETIELVKSNSKDFYLPKPKLKIFSDNIVLAIPKIEYFGTGSNEISSCNIMIFAAFFQIIALKYSLLIRGGISVDDLYIDDDFVYGKALTQSYKLESEVGIYPRIVINPKDLHLFTKSDFQRRILLKDSANIYYIDPFEHYFGYIHESVRNENLDIIRNNLEKMLVVNKDDKINQKICWFINMFNDFCIRNSYDDFVVNTKDYPYSYTKIETIVTGYARELENAK